MWKRLLFDAETASQKHCDVSVHHQYVLHNRESFVGGFYKAMSPKCIVTKVNRPNWSLFLHRTESNVIALTFGLALILLE